MTPAIQHGLRMAVLASALATGLAAAQDQGAAPGPRAGGVAADQSAPRLGSVSGLPLPRFVILRAPQANMRTGPGLRYPIDWVYTWPGLPVEVIDEFETWRRIRDWQGSVGWVHQNMLGGERRALVTGTQRVLRREPSEEAPGVAILEVGVIGRIASCEDSWCRLQVGNYTGWLREDEVFGIAPGEVLR